VLVHLHSFLLLQTMAHWVGQSWNARHDERSLAFCSMPTIPLNQHHHLLKSWRQAAAAAAAAALLVAVSPGGRHTTGTAGLQVGHPKICWIQGAVLDCPAGTLLLRYLHCLQCRTGNQLRRPAAAAAAAAVNLKTQKCRPALLC
jgi:hypothetical protein